MKIVAVSQRVDVLRDRDESRDALDQRLVMFIEAAGGLTVPVPNGLIATDSLSRWLSVIQPGAILLSGGNNIGEVNSRDRTESSLLDYASKNKVPVLGICRGMQMMAHWAGASLYPVNGHVRSRHQLFGKITGEVNSYHDYALVNCPDGFRVLAESEDGVIEAISHHSLPWHGWMWHPEREGSISSQDLHRFKGLLDG